jgi:hypothetical protein
MSMWTWIAIGVGAFFVLATTVALVVAGVLGVIADNVSALYETAEWTEQPLTREADATMDSEREAAAAGSRRR